MGNILTACTSKKACDKLDDFINVSVHGNVIIDKSVIENVVDKVENVVDKVENVVDKVENVVDKVENVVDEINKL